MGFYNFVKNGNATLKNIDEDQKEFKSDLNEIITGNTKHKSKDQLNTTKNIKNHYNSGEKAVKLYNDYTEIRWEAIYNTKQGIQPRILTPKQILQRLPIALGQIKASNSSEILLNEIRQVVYSLYQSKEITKKV